MSDLTSSCFAIHMRRAANSVSGVYDKHLRTTGLTVNQYSLLSKLRVDEVCTMSELANKAHLDRTTVIRMIRPLVDKKLIRDISSKGERNRKLQLTEAGDALVARAETLWSEAQNEILNTVGKEKFQELIGIFETLEEL